MRVADSAEFHDALNLIFRYDSTSGAEAGDYGVIDPSNINGDGVLDFLDILEFIHIYNS